jgi:hypothetical protein
MSWQECLNGTPERSVVDDGELLIRHGPMSSLPANRLPVIHSLMSATNR